MFSDHSEMRRKGMRNNKGRHPVSRRDSWGVGVGGGNTDERL